MSTLISKIQKDEQLYNSLLCSKGKEYRLEIPVVSELYSLLSENIRKYNYEEFEQIPQLDLTNLEAGVFHHNGNKLVSIIDVPKGTLKYHTFFSTKLFRESPVADLVSGKYFISFCYDTTEKLHLIPEGFSYLILDIVQNDVIPFHAIEKSLPEDLSIHWVYFAMNKLKNDFYGQLDISSSLDAKEIEVLKSKGYL